MPILMKDGKFMILNEDYEPNFEKTIESSIRNAMFFDNCFGFTYVNTKDLIDRITASVLRAISDFKELSQIVSKEMEGTE